MLKPVLIAFLLALAGSGRPPVAAVPEVVVRVFTLKHRSPEEALVVVRPLLTEGASVVVQATGNTLTVRDSAAAVERAAKTLAAWDLPPRRIDLTVTLLRASTDGRSRTPGVPDGADQIPGVGERLRKLFRFTEYARLDAAVVQGVEGQTVAYVLGGGYRLEFQIDPAGDPQQVRLKGLRFERIRRAPGPGVAEVRSDILRTTINVAIGQPYILAVGKDEAAAGALILVFNGKVVVPGPGLGGQN
ncbi:MAG TPA: secretin N-terminal domain-containing protein [Thermoanaerobaculia bacterium]|nr:secretin N-terminal domain-containing protein [Thermoanaerobaculia bacterium]